MLRGLRVRIVKSTMPGYWYVDKIGQEFTVTVGLYGNTFYDVVPEYQNEQWIPSTLYINIDDVVILQQITFERYFTASTRIL